MIHELKIDDNYLLNLIKGTKKNEIRYNDRDYQIDDVLRFYPSFDTEGLSDYLYFKIVHIHSGLGMAKNYICLSLEKTTLDA